MEPRAVLSCASCRQRKLKCDRNEPCSNCISRGVDCIYASAARGRGGAGAASRRRDRDTNQQLDARLRHLEQLINQMGAQNSQAGSNSSRDASVSASSNLVSTLEPCPQLTSAEIEPGHIMASDDQMSYVSATHWAAISNEIAEIRQDLDRDSSADEAQDPYFGGEGPMLLEGLQTVSDMQDILSDVPRRNVSDRLLSRYFNATGISIRTDTMRTQRFQDMRTDGSCTAILHAPTFQQEYNRFWLEPQNVLPAWLSLLFGVLGTGLLYLLQSQEYVYELLGDPMVARMTFQKRSTECLIISKYSGKPGPYTIEALMHNIQGEFVKRSDPQVGVWALAGLTIRLALRLGYHRDPDAYPEISVPHGENRRRVWAVIQQLDGLTSGQIGLPPMIQDAHCDARPPLNLLDEDYGPDSTKLPPSRPETEMTPVLFTISKERVSSVYRKILNRVILGPIESYNEILKLDQQLHDARDSIPPPLRLESVMNSATSPPYVLIRRYSLALLTQKSRCLLHCHYMKKSLQKPEYNFSRSSCVEAAMTILKLQGTLMREVQVGGILYRDKWIVSSLEQNDFFLASMIVCLEFSYRDRVTAPSANGSDVIKYSRQELIQALHGSYRYLQELTTNSKEARYAFRFVSAILRQVPESTHMYGSGEFGSLSNDMEVGSTAIMSQLEACTDNSSSFYTDIGFGYPSFASAGEGIEAFLESPGMVDWDILNSFNPVSDPMGSQHQY